MYSELGRFPAIEYQPDHQQEQKKNPIDFVMCNYCHSDQIKGKTQLDQLFHCNDVRERKNKTRFSLYTIPAFTVFVGG